MIRRGRGMLAVVRTTGRRKSLVQPTTPDRYLRRLPLQAAGTTVVSIRAFSNHYQHQQHQQQQQTNHGTQSLMMPVAVALAAAAATTAGTVSCANRDGKTRDSPNDYDRSKDEVLLATTATAAASMESSSMEWFRVNEDDVDALVELLMADKNVNIAMLPDGLEAQLYKNTVLLTLNAIYSLLKGLQGTKILSHEVHVKALMIDLGGGGRTTTDGGGSTPSPHTRTPSWLVQAVAESTTRPINDQVLQQVAQRLLANPVVNSPWISDALEAQIYTACLQVIFRVTQIILSSIKIRLCGHEIQLSLAFDDGFEKALLKSSENLVHHHPTTTTSTRTTPKRITMMTPVDLEVLKQLARNCGVSNNNKQDYSWWNRLVTRSNFVEQLHVSLYGLVLGLLDDLFLGQLQIQILSDTIGFDLIPAAAKDSGSPLERTVLPGTKTETNEGPSASTTTSSSSTTSQSTTVPFMVTSFFLAGIGTGVALSTVLGNQKS